LWPELSNSLSVLAEFGAVVGIDTSGELSRRLRRRHRMKAATPTAATAITPRGTATPTATFPPVLNPCWALFWPAFEIALVD